MADEIKKTREEQMRESANRAAAQQAALGEAYAQGLADATSQQAEALGTIHTDYSNAANAAMQRYQQLQNERHAGLADMLIQQRKDFETQNAQDEEQIRNDVKAARWTGATELAASLANLIGVGSFNAANQQYKQYSQDWMRKADADMRMQRARLDNFRERQRAMQMHINQLKQGDANTALNMAMRQADADRAARIQQADANYKAQLAPLEARYKSGLAAIGEQAKGEQQAINIGLHEDQRAWQERENARNRAVQYSRMNSKTGGRGGSSSRGSGDRYDVTINGRPVVLTMSKQSYEQAIESAAPHLRKDIMAAAGFNGSWSEFTKKVESDKRGRTYSDEVRRMVGAINGSGDDQADMAAIARYVKDNSDSVNNFNLHLSRVADRDAEIYGYEPEEGAGTSASEGAAQSGQKTSGVSLAEELRGDNSTVSEAAAPSSIADDLNDQKSPAANPPVENRRNMSKLEERGEYFKAVRAAAERSGNDSLRKLIGIGPSASTRNLMDAGRNKNAKEKYWSDDKPAEENLLYSAGLGDLIPHLTEDERLVLRQIAERENA